ncbi:uncharacterized protein MICPUCDRAFT_54729 [Micromonas pusilla CCMP1545]|uniref:Predicted protein n=1 Tax=Micromonas pusilla (strain CCMP1545) TaxID=564608 RepID=C1NA18_MICPC|nr:uncharacterized protein MICPUCDRAFT_54729 [Micromonas pusilla CCMP1545]EEH51168.1 predicted protein [Micromonas pusilla CCMP1545]|eukprot:XP_003064834.1 predicted protein [Micromonas pusilla CCMP1545]
MQYIPRASLPREVAAALRSPLRAHSLFWNVKTIPELPASGASSCFPKLRSASVRTSLDPSAAPSFYYCYKISYFSQ